MVRKALSVGALLLALFHVGLFLDDLLAGQLADPSLVLRWLIAIALVWGLASLRRRGVSLWFSREAVAIWAMAVLLHGPAVAGRIDALDVPMPAVAAVLAQAAVSAAALGWILLVVFCGAASRRRLSAPSIGWTAVAGVGPIGALSAAARRSFASRPPPTP